MAWRALTKDEQATYCSNVKLTPNETLVYFVKTREVRKVRGYDSLDIAQFDRFDWDAADKINVKIPKPVRESKPQWTIVVVDSGGKYSGFHIGGWEWPMWHSQKAAEKEAKRYQESMQKYGHNTKLKAVLWDDFWASLSTQRKQNIG